MLRQATYTPSLHYPPQIAMAVPTSPRREPEYIRAELERAGEDILAMQKALRRPLYAGDRDVLAVDLHRRAGEVTALRLALAVAEQGRRLSRVGLAGAEAGAAFARKLREARAALKKFSEATARIRRRPHGKRPLGRRKSRGAAWR